MSKERKTERAPELKEIIRDNGSVEAISGCMFCGKTDELIRRLENVSITLKTHVDHGRLSQELADEVIKVFKPSIDNRYGPGAFLYAHNKRTFPAILINKEKPREEVSKYITNNTLIVAFDEAQFFPAELLDVCNELAEKGVRVIAAGLDTNFRGEAFGIMGELITSADKKDAYTAICMVCGKTATRTQRLKLEDDGNGNTARKPAPYNDPLVVVGAKDLYEARCRHHHEVPGRPDRKMVFKSEVNE